MFFFLQQRVVMIEASLSDDKKEHSRQHYGRLRWSTSSERPKITKRNYLFFVFGHPVAMCCNLLGVQIELVCMPWRNKLLYCATPGQTTATSCNIYKCCMQNFKITNLTSKRHSKLSSLIFILNNNNNNNNNNNSNNNNNDFYTYQEMAYCSGSTSHVKQNWIAFCSW